MLIDVHNIRIGGRLLARRVKRFFTNVAKYLFRTVPAGAASGYATIEQIEGNTVVWNQLLKQGKLVDMGLPSGLLWATCNIDITQEDGFAASPFQYGCTMFSWGNIEGHNTPASGTTFDYNWGSVNAQAPWYEGQVYGSTPGNTLTDDIVAGDTYDAVRQNVRLLWKMPSMADFQELIDNIDYIDASGTVIPSTTADKRITFNGVVGIRLKSKINGNELFFACIGYGSNLTLTYQGERGYYWSNSHKSSRTAYTLGFSGTSINAQASADRFRGHALRPVISPTDLITVGHDNHKYAMNGTHNNCHDLTAIFGAGNEPTTVAEFEAWMAQNIGSASYYDFNAGELLSVKMSGVQTEDSNQQTLDTIALDVTTITGVNTSTNVREVIFADGMKQADREGTVKDTLDLRSDMATVNCGSVDLGDLNYQWDNERFRFTIGTEQGRLNIKTNTSAMLCDSYTYVYQAWTHSGDDTIGVGTVQGYINDATHDGTALVNGHASFLEGVELIYELATPITYTDLQDANGNPLNPRYKIEQGGTEQVLPVNTSTPTTVAPTLSTIYKKA